MCDGPAMKSEKKWVGGRDDCDRGAHIKKKGYDIGIDFFFHI